MSTRSLCCALMLSLSTCIILPSCLTFRYTRAFPLSEVERFKSLSPLPTAALYVSLFIKSFNDQPCFNCYVIVINLCEWYTDSLNTSGKIETLYNHLSKIQKHICETMISYIFKPVNYLIVDQCASIVHIYKVQSNIEYMHTVYTGQI